MSKLTVGVLALQGCIKQHEEHLALLGVQSRRVLTPQDLSFIDGLILPGGESTTMLKLADLRGLWEPLKTFCRSRPCWGVCAGAILLATKVTNPRQKSLGAIEILARRNAYGSQRESFKAIVSITATQERVHADFIRAPELEALSDRVTTLATLDHQPVGFQQNLCIATSFHSELGQDPVMHRIFVDLIEKSQASCVAKSIYQKIA